MTRHRHAYRTDSADADALEGTVVRFDRGELLAPTVRDDGTVLISGRTAKPGVLVYLDANGNEFRELVLPEDLHRADSLGTLGRAPVTLEHPSTEVTPDNVGQVGVGDVDGEVFVEEDGFVTVRMAVRRRDAIDAIRAGKVELSPGYRVRIEETAGIHPVFGRYDAIQRERRYNHLAIVDRARGGASVRLRTDGAAYQVDDDPTGEGAQEMNPLLIALLATLEVSRTDSEDVDLTKATERVDGLLKASVDLGALQADMATLQGALDAMTGERDALQAQLDAIGAAEQEKLDAAELERLDGMREILGLDKVENEGKGAMLHRIATHFDSAISDGASPDYMHGVIKAGMAFVERRADSGAAWAGLKPKTEPEPKNNPPNKRDDAADTVSPTRAQINHYADAFNGGRGEG